MSTDSPPDYVTLRDRIRLQALLLASTGYRWKIEHLIQSEKNLDESNRATIQRTLRAMTDQGLLVHPSGAAYYKAGPLLEDIGKEVLGESIRLPEEIVQESKSLES